MLFQNVAGFLLPTARKCLVMENLQQVIPQPYVSGAEKEEQDIDDRVIFTFTVKYSQLF